MNAEYEIIKKIAEGTNGLFVLGEEYNRILRGIECLEERAIASDDAAEVKACYRKIKRLYS